VQTLVPPPSHCAGRTVMDVRAAVAFAPDKPFVVRYDPVTPD
jgi:hypothetical protein